MNFDEVLEKLLGVYEVDGLKLELIKESNEMFLVMDDEYNLPVYPISKNLLHHRWVDEEYSYTRDADGQLYLWGLRKK